MSDSVSNKFLTYLLTYLLHFKPGVVAYDGRGTHLQLSEGSVRRRFPDCAKSRQLGYILNRWRTKWARSDHLFVINSYRQYS